MSSQSIETSTPMKLFCMIHSCPCSAGSAFGETKRSCIVYGMPKAAMRLGAVAEERKIDGLAERLLGRPAGVRAAPGAAR